MALNKCIVDVTAAFENYVDKESLYWKMKKAETELEKTIKYRIFRICCEWFCMMPSIIE